MTDITTNRRAHADYDILKTYEAGIELLGFEVKSAKTGRASLTGAFAVIRDRQAWLLNANIPPYQTANTPSSYEPARTRRLLIHSREIKELTGAAATKGLTIVPLKLYTRRGRVKVQLGLARHRKRHDKRQIIKKREAARDIARTLKRE
jgi:SsrA-binding protein